ncbi:MAG: LuxR C-terminal-related transcriptional regulator [Thermoleophilaceae bacterium]
MPHKQQESQMYDLAAAESSGAGASDEGWRSLFRAVLQNARNPMALVDEDRHIVDVNPPATALTGFARPQLIGRVADEFVSDREKDGFRREWRQLLLTGDGVAEREMLCADGGTVTIQYTASRRVVGGRRFVLYLATHIRSANEPAETPAIRGHAFSPREQEIVRLVAQGFTTRDIADELRLSLETVRTHIRNAMGKLRARTRAQLVAKALQERLM